MAAGVIHGTSQATIRYDEFLVKCPSCEADQWAEAKVYSNYFHIYWIPMWPLDKDVYLVCEKCGLRRDGVPFNEKLIRDFDNVKRKFRHPWHTYIGLAVIVLTIIGGIAAVID